MLKSEININKIYNSEYHGCYFKILAILVDGVIAVSNSHHHYNFHLSAIPDSELEYLEDENYYYLEELFNNMTIKDVQ